MKKYFIGGLIGVGIYLTLVLLSFLAGLHYLPGLYWGIILVVSGGLIYPRIANKSSSK